MELFGLGISEVAMRLVLGLVVGFCIGLTGIGSGLLVLPVLTMLFRMNAVMAVGTASLYAFLTKVSATFHHARLKNIDWALSSFFLYGAIPVNLLVAWWVSRQGGDVGFSHQLRQFIAGLVCFCALVMALNVIRQVRRRRGEVHVGKMAAVLAVRPQLRQGISVVIGGVIGALLAAASIGGGVLLVPVLLVVFGCSARTTVGCTVFVAVVLNMLTALNYLTGSESMCVPTAVVMAVGSLVGVPFGSRLSVRMPELTLQSVVLVLVFAVAVVMLVGSRI